MTRTWSDLVDQIRRLFEDVRILTVTGGYWGDEGKGKIIDAIASQFDIVARFSGGANAGHTVRTADGIAVDCHLIPCGIAQGKPSVLGPGELIDLDSYGPELRAAHLALEGRPFPPIMIDHRCPVKTVYGELLEQWGEMVRGKGRLDTTMKAMGPTAFLDVARLGIRVSDLLEGPDRLGQKLFQIFNFFNPIFRTMYENYGIQVPHPDFVALALCDKARGIEEYVCDTTVYLNTELKNGARILAEGAQSIGLDRTYGTYPFVSSGNSVAEGAPLGLGIKPGNFDKTLAVLKDKPTRVGAGPFPTEYGDRTVARQLPIDEPKLFECPDTAARLEFLKIARTLINSRQAPDSLQSKYYQVLRREKGVTSGRGRSVGRADCGWTRYALRCADMIAYTCADVNDGINEIEVCLSYQLDGQKVKTVTPHQLHWVTPNYQMIRGWGDARIAGIQDYDDLAESARNYFSHMEMNLSENGDIPIVMIGTGPNREDLIVRER